MATCPLLPLEASPAPSRPAPTAQREQHQWGTLEKHGNLPQPGSWGVQAPAAPTTFCDFSIMILSHYISIFFNCRSSQLLSFL